MISKQITTNQKPIISYFNRKGDNPTLSYEWVNNLSDINIIRTRFLDDKFIDVVNAYKSKLYLHIVISGFGQTPLEPESPTVKYMFFALDKLIKSGFPQNKILIIVDPIILNLNGLKALELLLKLFTEYNVLRLRIIRFELLSQNDYERYIINKYKNDSNLLKLIQIDNRFYKEYYKLFNKFRDIIQIDDGKEQLIGVRELMQFGYGPLMNGQRLIEYKNFNRRLPILREL